MMKKFRIAALLAAVSLISVGAAHAQDAKSKLDEVLARGVLVMGTGSTNAPWHFKDEPTTSFSGFDVDMGRIIAKAIFDDPDKVEFVIQSSDARIPNISTDKVDITCQFMTVTPNAPSRSTSRFPTIAKASA